MSVLANRWGHESDAVLRSLWAEELPTAEIASRLGCSRSAVIGRAARLALPARRAANKRMPGASEISRPCAPIPIVKPRQQEPQQPSRAMIICERLVTRWADMAPGQCRNIIGDEEDVFDRLVCGNGAETGSSYCSACRPRMWCSPEQVLKLLKRKPEVRRPAGATT